MKRQQSATFARDRLNQKEMREAMKAAFYTLGCKVNQYEAEVLSKQFEKEGFTIVSPEEPADVYVVNSCTVTATGDKKTKQILRHFRRLNGNAVIALTGCFPQAFPEEAARIQEADIVMGARNRNQLIGEVKKVLENRSRIVCIAPHEAGEAFESMSAEAFAEHTRAFVKIEDGCDRWCTYCIIPKARGPIRSKPLEQLRTELETLTQNGYREIVLVGINLSSYGKETGYAVRLADAVELACSLPGVKRVRLGSLEPELMSDEDLDRLAALEKFCPQFHLSLQSGCGATLKRMNRHYTPEEYARLTEKIRARFDMPSVTTDIMVGFPGETSEEFEESVEFAKRIGFAKAHVFAYSPRKGTRAAEMEHQVAKPEKERRSRIMMEAADETRAAFWESQKGQVHEVLFETLREDGTTIGYTKNYTPVIVRSEADIRGEIFPVEIQGTAADGCVGTIIHH